MFDSDSAKGFHVLDEYFENTFEDVLVPFKAVLQHRVTYNVRTKVGKNLTIARNITIEDVTSNRPYKLEGHWNGNQWPESLLLNLVASHEQEIRRYVLRFVKPKPSIHSNAISNK